MRLSSRLGRLDRRLFAMVAGARLRGLERVVPALSRAADNSLLWAGLAGALAVSGRRPLRRAATRSLLAVSLASPLVNLVGKQAFGRNRPSVDGLPLPRLVRMPTSASFPSGHSASAAAFATAVALEAPRAVATPVAVLAAAVCFSRVYTGVHYPGDVLAGAGIGLAAGLLTRRIWPDASEAGHARAAVTAPSARLDPEGEGTVAVVDSSAGDAASVAGTLGAALPDAEIVEVEPGADLADAVRRAASRAKVLAVAGGDDMVNFAAQETAGGVTPLLVVPAGTTGHFARTLGVESAEEAVAAYRGGDVVAVDVAEVAGRTFVNTASLGVYPEVVKRRERRQGRIGKWPALFWAMAEVLGPGGAQPVALVVDGVPRRVWMIVVGNCRYEARGAAPTRRQRLEDGLLDIRVLAAADRLPRLRVFLSLLAGRVKLSRHYQQWQADTLRVSSPSGRLALARDGETFEVSGEAEFTKRPRSLLVIRPGG
ncbi:undecaprenyl-diphosphatase [Streptosporangium becharense]|uniref:Undecaprenyl-diphosphatase n=1 Tax=Streptosporangium becharense TaxID=1816182 RepID=A0A7W9IML6_9ACTN|nr:phosphatase PAP2 family protein [Streptosporangium becharense]MBB2915109.1 undecaprenyl-diphosphatase [Streptosporangium becharense]MBB5822819.1 undecaprenyl-diphosphatase [Streptosporangium becharense]